MKPHKWRCTDEIFARISVQKPAINAADRLITALAIKSTG
jgi:hypothetical protein